MSSYLWLAPLTVYFVFGAAGYLLRRKMAVEHINSRLANVVFYLVFLLPAAIVLGLVLPHDVTPGWIEIILMLAGGGIWPLYGLASFRASKQVSASVFSLVGSASPVFTLVVAYFVMNERLSYSQIAGFTFLIVSAVIALYPLLRRQHKATAAGVWFALLSALLMGVGMAFEKFMLGRVEFGTYLLYGWSAQVLWMVLFSLRLIPRMKSMLANVRVRRYVLAFGASGLLRSLGFIVALSLSSGAAIVGAASNFMTIVVVIAAFIFLRERNHMHFKIPAAIIGVIGLFLLR